MWRGRAFAKFLIRFSITNDSWAKHVEIELQIPWLPLLISSSLVLVRWLVLLNLFALSQMSICQIHVIRCWVTFCQCSVGQFMVLPILTPALMVICIDASHEYNKLFGRTSLGMGEIGWHIAGFVILNKLLGFMVCSNLCFWVSPEC